MSNPDRLRNPQSLSSEINDLCNTKYSANRLRAGQSRRAIHADLELTHYNSYNDYRLRPSVVNGKMKQCACPSVVIEKMEAVLIINIALICRTTFNGFLETHLIPNT